MPKKKEETNELEKQDYPIPTPQTPTTNAEGEVPNKDELKRENKREFDASTFRNEDTAEVERRRNRGFENTQQGVHHPPYPTPKSDRNKKIAIIVLLGTILIVGNLWGFMWWNSYDKKVSSVNVDSPSVPITNNYQNSFPSNITIVVQLDEKILNKTISEAVESTLKKLNLTNSSG